MASGKTHQVMRWGSVTHSSSGLKFLVSSCANASASWLAVRGLHWTDALINALEGNLVIISFVHSVVGPCGGYLHFCLVRFWVVAEGDLEAGKNSGFFPRGDNECKLVLLFVDPRPAFSSYFKTEQAGALHVQRPARTHCRQPTSNACPLRGRLDTDSRGHCKGFHLQCAVVLPRALHLLGQGCS